MEKSVRSAAMMIAIVAWSGIVLCQSLGSSASETIDNVNPSVFRIQVTVQIKLKIPATSDGPPQEVFGPISLVFGGSGFAFDDDWHIATAYHVVDVPNAIDDWIRRQQTSQAFIATVARLKGWTEEPKSIHLALADGVTDPKIEVLFYSPSRYDQNSGRIRQYDVRASFIASIYKQDKGADIAILSCPSLVPFDTPYGKRFPGSWPVATDGRLTYYRATIAKMATTPPRSGEEILVSGFPALGVSEESVAQTPGITTDAGTISNPAYLYLNRPVFLAHLRSNHGDSGGPVFDSRSGAVIGFVDAYLSGQEGDNSSETVVVPIWEVIRLDRSH